MARNEEKAQSMLYRFREAQAAELGLGTRSDRRPRMASSCKSLRECERWRGEILREVSRKVSKIQDAGLTDYEVRDLNDEINKLLREKRHWENQIVALGGANYRRNVAMLDDDGKEVPGTKGYKYFGRAKELPGVKELFQGRKKEEDEENQALAFYKKFQQQGPAYYGDLDEKDEQLIKFERKTEEEEWQEASSHIKEILGLQGDETISLPPRYSSSDSQKHNEADSGDVDMKSPETDPSGSEANGTSNHTAPDSKTTDVAYQSAQAAAAYIPFLTPDDLLPPKLPTKEEMESIILGLRKRALVEEYFGQ